MNPVTMLSKLSSATTSTKLIVAAIAIAAIGSSLAACSLVSEDTESSEAEFRNATTDRLPEAKWLNR